MRGLARMHLPERQRGAALLILLALFAVAAAYMLVTSLNKSSVALSLARSDKNRAVMQEAKAALIAWSASEALQTQSGGIFQPGALPCPDRTNNGSQESSCGSSDRLGRLPYKTLGIGELRDASGELLWYAVSSKFRRRTGNVINSDTQGQLSISGLAPASNAIAVVLAPGSRLGTQDRSPDEATCTANNNKSQPCNTALNYLEDTNGIADTTSFISKIENLTDPAAANLFNDQLLAITHQDLFSVVEPVVAGRIERDIVRQFIYDPTDTSTNTQWSDVAGPNKSRYFNAWGGFPFADTFADPSSSNFTGVVGNYEGLLPVVDSATFIGSANYTWTLGSGSVVLLPGGSGSISSFNCGATTSSTLRCNITSSGFISAPKFRMSGTVNNVGRAFVQLPRVADVSTSGINGTRSLSGSLNSAGAGIVMLDATMPFSFGGTTITVTINNNNLIDSPLLSTTITDVAGWFNNNQWYKQTYYAVSPGYAPGGASSCNPSSSPNCLNVYNLASPYANPTTDTRAILILAGRSLSGTTRPNGTLSDYLEAKNYHTVVGYAFEHTLGKTTTVAGAPVAINDRVIVIAP